MKQEIKEPEDLIKQQCTDAYQWAKMFERAKIENSWSIEDIDEGLMISWFASAIVTTQDAMHVSCITCIHHTEATEHYGHCMRSGHPNPTEYDWFCAGFEKLGDNE